MTMVLYLAESIAYSGVGFILGFMTTWNWDAWNPTRYRSGDA